MDEWITRLCDALDVPIADVDINAVLDLARDAAHNVDRPAAPITTYIVGVLLGFVALLMSSIQLGWAIAAVGGTMSVACLSAYLLMKVDMRS